MFDDDLFNMFNSYGTNTTTETENQTSETTSPNYGTQTGYNPYNVSSNEDFSDDYSVTPNYEEQQNYNSSTTSYDYNMEQEQSKKQMYAERLMQTPVIQKEEQTVNLIKKREKIELHARMKIAIAMFAVIVASLMFAIVYNFVSAGAMKATFAGKQVEISALQASISGLKDTYTSLSDDEQIKLKAESEGYVDQSGENTIEITLNEASVESTIQDLPSNWFNDVCDFLSGIFG